MQTNNSQNITDFNSFDTDINQLDAFLNYKIFTIANHTLTPGIFVLIGLVFLFAWLLILLIKRIFVGKRTETDNEYGRRFSVYMILRYVTFVISFVLILELVGVGLNTFLVGSAALLVGVGLGLQHIFSDLISGLFLLFERPIELGDVIEVDGIIGRIQQIKLRHTVILNRDGVNLIVPNHKFVTEKVINWSHQSDLSRFVVNIGVDYSSDPKLINKLLKEVANKHSLIVNNDTAHPVFVRFADFGDSALAFQLFFWTRHSFIVENIKSELRFEIFEVFAQNGIKIPFPQRDLHIKSGNISS